MIEVRNLTKVYQRGGIVKSRHTAVEGVSFCLDQNHTLGIIGESGCGKSTIANLIMRLLRPTSGEILIDGTDTADMKGRTLKQYRKQVQIVFQNPESSLDPRMTIRNSIREALRNYQLVKLNTPEERQFLSHLMDTVGLQEEQLDRYPRELSGGQLQRAVLARILALKPSILIADEPTSMLDVSVQAQILALMQMMKEDLNLAILFISHDLDVVRVFCDEVMVMYRGRIVECGKTSEVLDHSLHPYTKSLVYGFYHLDCDTVMSEETAVPKSGTGKTENRDGCLFQTQCPLKKEKCEQFNQLLKPEPGKHRALCCQKTVGG